MAAVKVGHHFRQKSNAATFDEFVAEYPRLITSFKELLLQHYDNKVSIFNDTSFVDPNSKKYNNPFKINSIDNFAKWAKEL